MKSLILFLALSFSTQAQEIYRNLAKTTVTVEETTILLSYRDMSYQYIDAFESLVFTRSEFEEFLNACIEVVETGEPKQLNGYNISKYGTSAKIRKGNTYTILGKGQIKKIKSKL